jgi:hypothetical protein
MTKRTSRILLKVQLTIKQPTLLLQILLKSLKVTENVVFVNINFFLFCPVISFILFFLHIYIKLLCPFVFSFLPCFCFEFRWLLF